MTKMNRYYGGTGWGVGVGTGFTASVTLSRAVFIFWLFLVWWGEEVIGASKPTITLLTPAQLYYSLSLSLSPSLFLNYSLPFSGFLRRWWWQWWWWWWWRSEERKAHTHTNSLLPKSTLSWFIRLAERWTKMCGTRTQIRSIETFSRSTTVPVYCQQNRWMTT